MFYLICNVLFRLQITLRDHWIFQMHVGIQYIVNYVSIIVVNRFVRVFQGEAV
jgi:hypothetical protein